MGMVLVKAGGAIIEVDSSGCCTKTARAADKDKAVMQLVGGKEESVVNVTGHSTLGSNLNKVLCHASFLTHMLQFRSPFMCATDRTV